MSARRYQVDRNKVLQNIIYSLIRHRFQEIKDYYEELEAGFEGDLQRISERYDKEVDGKQLSEEQQQEIGEYFGEEHFRIQDVFLKNLRYSVVVIFYSFLENTLNDLCRHLCRVRGLKHTLDETDGKGIERAKRYFKKVCLINFPESSREWQEIKNFSAVRNCISHAEGNVEKMKNPTPERIKEIVGKTNGLNLGGPAERYIQIEREYILSIMGDVNNFIRDIHELGFATIPADKPLDSEQRI